MISKIESMSSPTLILPSQLILTHASAGTVHHWLTQSQYPLGHDVEKMETQRFDVLSLCWFSSTNSYYEISRPSKNYNFSPIHFNVRTFPTQNL
jgi:hypothetical protein